MLGIDDIISVAENVKRLKAFIEGELAEMLSTFGEVEYKAAADALRDAALARNRKQMVWQAVNHLQSAHAAYARLHEGRGGMKEMARMATRMAAVHKDLFTMSLLAVCYRYLGEGRLMEKTLGDAVELLRDDLYEKTYTLGEMTDPKRLKEAAHDMFSVVASWMNPATYPVLVQEAQGRFPKVTREQMMRLCATLGYEPTVGLT